MGGHRLLLSKAATVVVQFRQREYIMRYLLNITIAMLDINAKRFWDFIAIISAKARFESRTPEESAFRRNLPKGPTQYWLCTWPVEPQPQTLRCDTNNCQLHSFRARLLAACQFFLIQF